MVSLHDSFISICGQDSPLASFAHLYVALCAERIHFRFTWAEKDAGRNRSGEGFAISVNQRHIKL